MHHRLALAALAFSSLPAMAAQPFDGSWFMSASTQSGTCAGYTFDVAIAEGRIETPQGVAVAGSGRVTPAGVVSVNFNAGGNAIAASGKAAGRVASGRWSSPTLACAGTWQAQRR